MATPITQVNFVEDYYTLFEKLSWFGISLSPKESFLFVNSLRNLSAKLQVGTFTFFWKNLWYRKRLLYSPRS